MLVIKFALNEVSEMKRFFYWAGVLSLPVLTLVILLVFFTVNAPFADDYDAILAYLIRPFPDRLLHLADFHNEHRIATARIVFETIYCALGHMNFRLCMVVGAVFLLGYGLLFFSMFKHIGVVAKWYYIPCFWTIVSVLNYDNICWAMTSVSNVPVLFWTLAAIILFAQRNARRNKWSAVIGAIVCASLATFSTGGGLVSWVGLLFVVFHEWLIDKGSWSNALKSYKRVKDVFRLEVFVVIMAFVICVIIYFHGMNDTALKDPAPIKNMLCFSLSFLGAVIPIYSVSVFIGIVVMCVIVFIFVTLPQNKNTIALALLVCLILCIGAATPFRAVAVDSALPGRYRIIPISIMVALFVALLSYFKFKKRRCHFICSMLFSFSLVSYLVLFSFLSLPNLATRNNQIRSAMRTWTMDTASIEHEANNEKRFLLLLKNAYLHGVYDPSSAVEPRIKE